jgi:hypothetical protein
LYVCPFTDLDMWYSVPPAKPQNTLQTSDSSSSSLILNDK